MVAFGFVLSLLWLAFFVLWRGRGSLGMKSVACVESLFCTPVAAWVLHTLTSEGQFAITFLVYSEALGLLGSCGFLVLAFLPDPNPDTQGPGLNPEPGLPR